MEVNTRVQVEHTVTEEVTGIDLVKEQIRIAMGEKLSFDPAKIEIRGHAMECRINAEDPVSFAPWPGKITAYHEPGGPGVRLDSMIYAGYTVPSLYDSMIAKLITRGRDRTECLQRMRRALAEMKVDGIRTNIPFHERLLQDPRFIDGSGAYQVSGDVQPSGLERVLVPSCSPAYFRRSVAQKLVLFTVIESTACC